jgi:hypothetical protein
MEICERSFVNFYGRRVNVKYRGQIKRGGRF